jgi:hypothetical protein
MGSNLARFIRHTLPSASYIARKFKTEGKIMTRRAAAFLVVTVSVLSSLAYFARPMAVRGQATAQSPYQSDEQVTGPYEVVKDWPKPLSTLFPEEKGWTWGATQAIYAQNPNRIFVSMRGELPAIRGAEQLGRIGSALGGAVTTADPLNIEWPGAGEDGQGIFLTLPTPGLPARNVRELVELAKARPRTLTYASAGPASMAHLAGALLEKMAGIELVHVPYRGTGQSVIDLIEGQGMAVKPTSDPERGAFRGEAPADTRWNRRAAEPGRQSLPVVR